MSIGSGTSAGIRNVTFTDIYFNGTSSGPRMKSSRGRGGAIEDITFNNFYIYNAVEYVGIFTAFYRHSPPTNATGTPKVNNIKITNMYVDGGKRGWDFDWLPESPIRGLYLSNITVKNFNTTENFWTKCQSVDGYCGHSSVSPSCPPCLNAGCPTNWYRSSVDNNQCYQVDNESLSWTDAQNSCQNLLLTSLTSVDNAFENSEITKYVSQTYPNCQKVYIGLQSNGNTWSWINGDNSTYRNWDTNYPSNNSNAYCAALNLVNGKWTNEACSNPECYICAFVLNE